STAAGGRLPVDWTAESSISDLALLGDSTHSGLSRLLGVPFEDLDHYLEVNVEDPVTMLPKSRRALTIQEIAALARSSLHGISQVVKDHVTKPTAMAQGRVAHLIEWKGWCKPTDAPNALESDFNSYSDLTEGEQEARFAAGQCVCLSVLINKKVLTMRTHTHTHTHTHTLTLCCLPADLSSYPHYLRDIMHTRVCEARLREAESSVGVDLSPPAGLPGLPGSVSDTLGSSMCSLEETHSLLRDLSRCGDDLTAKILGALHGREDLLLLARLQRLGQRRGHLFSETFEDNDTPCKDCRGGAWCTAEYSARRKVSDVASSGVVSLDEEDGEEEAAEEDAEEEEEE
ncbi:hypothetical protein C0J45_1096, partial [Silurus meridionalis]